MGGEKEGRQSGIGRGKKGKREKGMEETYFLGISPCSCFDRVLLLFDRGGGSRGGGGIFGFGGCHCNRRMFDRLDL